MPEAIELFQLKFKIIEGFDQELDDKINDQVSALFTMIEAFFALVGPIVGGALYDSIGYQKTMNFVMLMNIFCCLIYLVFNCGQNVFKNSR